MSTVTPSAPTVQPTIKNWLAQNWLGLTLAILVTLALVACFVVIGCELDRQHSQIEQLQVQQVASISCCQACQKCCEQCKQKCLECSDNGHYQLAVCPSGTMLLCNTATGEVLCNRNGQWATEALGALSQK